MSCGRVLPVLLRSQRVSPWIRRPPRGVLRLERRALCSPPPEPPPPAEKEEPTAVKEEGGGGGGRSDYGFSQFSRLLNYILPQQLSRAKRAYTPPPEQPPGVPPPQEQSESPSPPSKIPHRVKEEKPVRRTVIRTTTPPREPSREALEGRTRGLVKKLRSADSSASKLLRTEELCKHLLDYPRASSLAAQEGALQILLRFESLSRDEALKAACREGLALLGYVKPVRGRGIRVLSVDGGGTRGMMALEILEELERVTGRRIYELFDFVVGVSTGAVLSALLVGYRLTVPQSRQIYREISSRLFAQNRISGLTSLLWSHSYYDTSHWVTLLKESLGERRIMDTAREKKSVKLCFVSCVVNKPRLEAFVFRNYSYAEGRESVFPGSPRYKMWQSLQASAAAPGYFEEVQLDELLHQDGGVLVNNPTGIGLHECRLLWPKTPFQCVFSIGNGRSFLEIPKQASSVPSPKVTSLQEKIIKIVDSATDTELVHTLLNDLLPSRRYFRFNPYISHPYTLDETDPKKIEDMLRDARLYIRKNRQKLRAAATTLLQRKSAWQRLKDFAGKQLILWFNKR